MTNLFRLLEQVFRAVRALVVNAPLALAVLLLAILLVVDP